MTEHQSPLFSADLIPTAIQDKLPAGYTLRPLQRDDYHHGHLRPLQDLAYVGEISAEEWQQSFDAMAAHKGAYFTVVIVNTAAPREEQIIATGTLVTEMKFLMKRGLQGHIEDIAVMKDHQGRKFGPRLLEALNHIAEQVGCYKTILDCSVKNIGFYEKCGYQEAGREMHCYYSEEAKQRGV